MELFIALVTRFLSKFLLLPVLFGLVCTTSYAQFLNKKWPQATLMTPNSNEIPISWAISPSEKVQGLSDLNKEAMPNESGLFFYYRINEHRVFWMPSTRFDLDIIFLDKNLKIVGIEHNVQHFKKRQPEKLIPRTKSYYSRYVLELHSGQAKKLKLKKGLLLKWKRPSRIKKFISNL